MMRYFIILILVLPTLVGCGGGSSSSESSVENPPATANSAPTLSGTFTHSILAAVDSAVVLDVQDKDSDSVTVSISNQPNWFTFEQKNNQVHFTLSPTLFDVDNYKLKLVASDGKAQSEYEFIINVEDNRNKWAEVDVTETELLGNWASKDRTTMFTFSDQNHGLLFKDDSFFHFDYHIPDVVELDVNEYKCFFQTCQQVDFMEFEVVAKAADKLRVRLINTDEQETVLTLHKSAGGHSADVDYLVEIDDYTNERVSYLLYSKIDRIESSESHLNLPYFVSGNNSSVFSSASVITNIKNDSNFQVLNHQKDLTTLNFAHNSGFSTTERALDLELQILAVKVIAQFPEHIILEHEYKFTLKSDLNGESKDDYVGLTDALKAKKMLTAYKYIKRAEAPSIELGESYTGRIVGNVDLPFGADTYTNGGSVFKFLDEKNGEVALSSADKKTSLLLTFSYELKDNSLTIDWGDEQVTHAFFTMPSGDTAIDIAFADKESNTYSKSIFVFQKANQLNISPSEIQNLMTSTFQHLDNYWTNDNQYMKVHNSVEGFYTTNDTDRSYDHYVNFENDNSFTFIPKRHCEQALDFSSCLTEAEQTERVLLRNFKLIFKENDYFLFQYTVKIKSPNSNWNYQSLRGFKKLN